MSRWKSLIDYQTTREESLECGSWIHCEFITARANAITIIVLTLDSRDRVHVDNSSQKSNIRSRMYVHTLHYIDLLHNALFASHARSIHQGLATFCQTGDVR